VTVTRKFYTTEGKEWSGGTLEEGDSLIVQLSIKSSVDHARRRLVTDLLPAGLEIGELQSRRCQAMGRVVVDGIEIADRATKRPKFGTR
jgi:uncharacterized protein YfaS (alpha-2-macroglobulin family)